MIESTVLASRPVSEQEAYQNLLELTFVKDSEIHGKGLFAKCFIAKGTVIGQIIGSPTTVDGDHVLWITDDLGIHVMNNLRYINHSPEPTAAYYDDGEVVALRDIADGEEITHDYNGDSSEWLSRDEHHEDDEF
ncbi:SET domain protein [Poriferisphaera corsica]|uniref:SET domain protein n=1 Tax=Poriferisphaera corsica TaxID=2528020 RepID=A0A517YWQ5_9BACT|nr:SET domain-containing protein [Poriferisphaera corsica]QDU34668.1 SET domain protein [Poriferisphaera corsica]